MQPNAYQTYPTLTGLLRPSLLASDQFVRQHLQAQDAIPRSLIFAEQQPAEANQTLMAYANTQRAHDLKIMQQRDQEQRHGHQSKWHQVLDCSAVTYLHRQDTHSPTAPHGDLGTESDEIMGVGKVKRYWTESEVSLKSERRRPGKIKSWRSKVKSHLNGNFFDF